MGIIIFTIVFGIISMVGLAYGFLHETELIEFEDRVIRKIVERREKKNADRA